MSEPTSAFDDPAAISPQLLADGHLARAVHGEELTLAVVAIEAGAVLPEHSHANEHFGIVLEGSVIRRGACVGTLTLTCT
jgi:quercetin dioxygenase-like cupin family protein